MHSENVTTPLLILHGAADERVPTYQGRELFEVLRARQDHADGNVSWIAALPHSMEQRQDVFREIAAWLARYNP